MIDIQILKNCVYVHAIHNGYPLISLAYLIIPEDNSRMSVAYIVCLLLAILGERKK